MYKDLPKDLQQRVRDFLETNQFRKAKAIHDAWMVERDLIMSRDRFIELDRRVEQVALSAYRVQ